MPRDSSASISWKSTSRSTTTPLPITGVTPGDRMPDGSRCSAYFSSPMTTVCPALLPPLNFTTHSVRSPSRSVALPLPSSPHWTPMITIPGMRYPPEIRVLDPQSIRHASETRQKRARRASRDAASGRGPPGRRARARGTPEHAPRRHQHLHAEADEPARHRRVDNLLRPWIFLTVRLSLARRLAVAGVGPVAAHELGRTLHLAHRELQVAEDVDGPPAA